MNRILTSFIFLAGFFNVTNAQLVINNSLEVNQLVTKVLVGNNSHLLINNIVFTGSPESIGSFNYKLEHNRLISRGIIISTGRVLDAVGPNDVPNKGNESYKISGSGDNDLEKIAHAKTYDAVVLEFDFMSVTDSISFNFFFASEEYPEYVKKNVNDVFGFFLIDKEQATKTNMAVLPKSKTPIAIDHVNSQINKEYFIENTLWDTENLDFFRDHISLAELAYTLQFDGLTKPIHVGARVKPNCWYTLKLALADVGDDIFDTALFLEAESFKSSGKYSNGLPKEIITEVFPDQIVDLNDSLIILNFNIGFDFDSVTFSGEESYSFLEKLIKILSYDSLLYLEVQGYTDDIGTNEYNLRLSEKRAQNVKDHLIVKGIESHRIRSVGFGNKKPLSRSNQDQNRRVEFLFYKTKY